MKKVLILTASPHGMGNSCAMAAEFQRVAWAKKAEVKLIDMVRVEGDGCHGCEACHRSFERCIQEDEVTDVLRDFEDSDILVMASPVWWLDLPVYIRRFVERWHGLMTADFKPRIKPGKKAVLLLSQGAVEEDFKNLPERYREMLSWMGVELSVVRHCNSHTHALATSGVLDEVRELAEKLC